MKLRDLHKWLRTKLFTRHALGIIVVIQSVLIIYLTLASYLRNSPSSSSAAAAESDTSALVNQDVVACKKLSLEESKTCAKTTGIKIKSLFVSPAEQTQECMKFRPFLLRYCQEGLISESP